MRDLKIILIFNNNSSKNKSEIENILKASFLNNYKINFDENNEKNLSNKSMELNISKVNVKNKMKLIYELTEKKENINLFGDEFLIRNYNHKLIINNKIYTKNHLINNNNDKKIQVTFIFFDKRINLKLMFGDCSLIKSLSGKLQINPLNIKSISGMFYGCKSLESLSDLIFFDTWNIEDMSFLFCGCKKLIF